MDTQVHPPVDTPVDAPVNTQQAQTPPQIATQHAQMAPMARTPSPVPSPLVEPTPQRVPDRKLIAGVMLIAFGLVALLATLINSNILGLSILPTLGILFIVWALLARLPGLMIPGGILTGLGVGILLSDVAFGSASGDIRGGIIVLGLGVGFLMILPLIWLISPDRHWWALIPGGILALIGIALLVGGGALNVLNVLGKFWPVVPIIVGIYLIWQILRKR
jgi:hypothetical protein